MTENLVYTDLTKKNLRMNTNLAETNYRNARQTIFCSATIPQRQHFVQLAYKNGWTQSLAELVHVTPSQFTPFQITHELIDYVTAPTPAAADTTATTAVTDTKNSKRRDSDTDSHETDDNHFTSDNKEESEEEEEDSAMSSIRRAEQESRKRAYLKYIIRAEVKALASAVAGVTTTTSAATSKTSTSGTIAKAQSIAITEQQQQQGPRVIVFVDNAEEAYRVCNFLIDSIPSLFPSASTAAVTTAPAKSTAFTSTLDSGHNTDSRTAISQSRNDTAKTNDKFTSTVPVPSVLSSSTAVSATSPSLRALLRKKRGLPTINDISRENNAIGSVTSYSKQHDADTSDDEDDDKNSSDSSDKSNNDNGNDNDIDDGGDSVLVMRLDETMNIDQRALALEQYRKGACRVLVCTDLTARGIDVPETTLVIQVGASISSE